MPLNTSRDASIAAVLSEFVSGNPRERMFMFRKWLAGALSIVQLHVLTVLEASGPQSMGKLADQLDVSVASATGIIDRMEQRGLVERRHSVDDRRVILVHATEAGLKVFADLAEQRRLGMQAILDQLSDEEVEALAVGLRAMGAARSRLAAQAMAAEDAEGAVANGTDDPGAGTGQRPGGRR